MATVRWPVGIVSSLIGAMILVIPHRFAGPPFLFMHSHLYLWGICFLLSGIGIISIAVLAPRQPFAIATHAVVALTWLAMAFGFAMASVWVGTVSWGTFAVGVALAPLILDRVPSSAASTRYFALLAGVTAVLVGLVVVAMAVLGQLNTTGEGQAAGVLAYAGWTFLIAGGLLVYGQMVPSVPGAVLRAAYLACGTVYLAYGLFFYMPAGAWAGLGLYGIAGTTLLLIPWIAPVKAKLAPASLRTRLGLALAVAATLPAIAVVAFVSEQQETSMVNQTLALQQSLAATLARGVDDYVATPQAVVAQVAAQPGLSSMPPGEQSLLLKRLNTAYPDVTAFATFDSQGNPIARSDDKPLVPAAGYAIFEGARRTNAPSLDVLISPVFLRPVFSFAAPIRDGNGRFAGLVVAAMEPKKLGEILARSDPGPGTEAFLVDGRGRGIAFSERQVDQPFPDLSSYPPVVRLLTPGSPDEGAARYVVDRGHHLAGYSRVPGLGWGVVVDSVQAVALADVHSQRELSFFILLLFLAITLGFGSYAVRWLTRPIDALASAAQDLSAGNAAAPMPRSGIREIANLASAFGDMRNRLAARTAERERLLEELQQANSDLATANMQQRELAREAECQAAELGATISSIADAVTIYDARGRIVRMNPVAERLLAYSPTERELTLSQRAPWRRLKSQDGTPFAPDEIPVARALTGETVRGHVISFTDPAGHTRWVSASAAPIHSSDGELLGVVGVMTDVTPLYELEEMREDFLRGVCHDLRTPLTVVQGQAQILARAVEMGQEKETLKKSVTSIIQGAKRMNATVQDLVDITRQEQKQLDIREEAIALRPFFLSLLERSNGVLNAQRVRAEIPEDLAPLSADPNRLERVLTNLLTNALKYSPSDSEVLVTADSADRMVKVSICDHGSGIAPEDMGHLFERYYRAGDARKAEGLGLGLYISRILVEAQGGSIWVESQVGEGSTFTFTLPAANGGGSKS